METTRKPLSDSERETLRRAARYVAPGTTRPRFTDYEQEARLDDDTVVDLPFDALRTPAA